MRAAADLFQCGWCGSWTDLAGVEPGWERGEVTADVRDVEDSGLPEPGMPVQLWVWGLFCSELCMEHGERILRYDQHGDETPYWRRWGYSSPAYATGRG